MTEHNEKAAKRARLALKPGLINLNAGSASPAPLDLVRSAAELRALTYSDPVGQIWDETLGRIEANRTALAKYLNCDPAGLLLFGNTTYGLNTIVESPFFSPGTRIVMTDQEYHHYHHLWRRAEHELGISLSYIQLPVSDDNATAKDIEHAFAKVIRQGDFVFFSHVISATGIVLPAAAICNLARDVGATTIVDGAHAPGLIPVDLEDIRPDFYLGNCHKWLMGLVGAAFCYVSPSKRQTLRPIVANSFLNYKAAGAHDPIGTDKHEWPTYWQASHEYQGTQDRIPQCLIKAAIDFQTELGADFVTRSRTEGRNYVITKLQERGLRALSPPALGTSMVAFQTKPHDSLQLWQWFRREGFEVAMPKTTGLPHLVRISAAWFVTTEEIDAFFRAFDRAPWLT